ncbi:hypothetical protein BLNAU_20357 [Blattamonas nauphoetae]|uniref:Polymorphic outer membrane protein n=1 Tax=Blattamonas nauphoetae TaxID=2049346 RepID=A0ABQ9WYY4_9EUKA|nr:hypothetical protein BLNAU_20357 [Blattamonas nauphoetae]
MASLSFTNVQFAFDELSATAFKCDRDSSIKLVETSFKLTKSTVNHPFIDSIGTYVHVKFQYFLQPIKLNNTPFVRLINAEKDAVYEYTFTTPLLDAPLTSPFIVCEGATELSMIRLTLNYSFINSASFARAKTSAVKSSSNTIQLLSTVQGAFLHLENGSATFSSITSDSCSGTQGGLFYLRNATVTSSLSSNSCSATQGGVIYARDSSVNMSYGTISNCEAEEGGVAYLLSASLTITRTSFLSNSAKRGGVFWIDLGNDIASSISWMNSTVTDNSAHDVDENGVDTGKGGAFFVTGTTSSETPLVLDDSRFENTAAFGNDVFLEETVLGGKGPDILSTCGGLSSSGFPHIEIENHNLDDDELFRLSNFIPYPSVSVSTSSLATLTPACKWPKAYCKTITYALQFLQTAYPNGSLFQRQCYQSAGSMETEPIEFERHDLIYSSGSHMGAYTYDLFLSAAYEAVEGVVFTINDESRLTVQWIGSILKSLHRGVKVNSKDGQATMENCTI